MFFNDPNLETERVSFHFDVQAENEETLNNIGIKIETHSIHCEVQSEFQKTDNDL
jgi:hypothetical protein